jgi:hypothetical protein
LKKINIFYIQKLNTEMSSGYNLSMKYPYLDEQRRKVMEMERKHQYWQPQLHPVNRFSLQGGKAPSVGSVSQNPTVSSGRRAVGFKDLTTYSDLYKKVPQTYKSSGNDGHQYFMRHELSNINKAGLPYKNYGRRKYNNAADGFTGDPEVFESVKKVFEDDSDRAQLEIPEHVDEKKKRKAPAKKGGARSGGFTGDVGRFQEFSDR